MYINFRVWIQETFDGEPSEAEWKVVMNPVKVKVVLWLPHFITLLSQEPEADTTPITTDEESVESTGSQDLL